MLIIGFSKSWWQSYFGWNSFQPQIDRVQNRWTFLWTVWIYRGIIRAKIDSLESVTFQVNAHMLSSIIKKLWTFFGPWGRDRSQSPPCWIFRVKQIDPSMASEKTTRLLQPLPCWNILWIMETKGFFHLAIIINALVSSFCFIWIPMLYYGSTAIINILLFQLGDRSQNVTSVVSWYLASLPLCIIVISPPSLDVSHHSHFAS